MAQAGRQREQDKIRPRDHARGRDAESPGKVPLLGWKDILLRVKDEYGRDHLDLVAAGSAFYALLALFPAITAVVSIYGLVMDPQEVAAQTQALRSLLPADAMTLLTEQMNRVAQSQSSGLSLAFAGSLLLAWWSSNKGVAALIQALNIVYEEEEKRGFFKLKLVSLAMTTLALLATVSALAAMVAVPLVLAALDLDGALGRTIAWARWPALLVVAVLALAALYRYAPCRRVVQWRWIVWVSAGVALTWLVLSFLFGWYVANFGAFNETYGSLGAVIGFIVWLWLSLLIVLVGAELSAEMEHQTARDSTSGPERPMGERGARMADTLGEERA